MNADMGLDAGVFEVHDKVLLLNLMGKAFADAVDLDRKSRIFHLLDKVEAMDDVRVVIFNFNLEQMDRESYLAFFDKGFAAVSTNRFCNMLMQLSERLAGLNKFTMHLAHGNLVTAFLSLSLFCDYRVISDETVYYNAYLDLDATPMGGLAYFLSTRLGRGKALELMLLNKEITAPQALGLGLVDRVVPAANREAETLELAARFAAAGKNSLTGVKRLMAYSLTHIPDYLEFEKKVFLQRFCL